MMKYQDNFMMKYQYPLAVMEQESIMEKNYKYRKSRVELKVIQLQILGEKEFTNEDRNARLNHEKSK